MEPLRTLLSGARPHTFASPLAGSWLQTMQSAGAWFGRTRVGHPCLGVSWWVTATPTVTVARNKLQGCGVEMGWCLIMMAPAGISLLPALIEF